MQCTGQELPSEQSSDEKKEALKQVMSGKRVLLCLDDMWEEEHGLELNFVDVSAGSKVLISTRMQGLLDGGHQVEVGLPSPSDSARMILRAADADSATAHPAGVSEIVDLCGRVPLALGIAGRLAASLGLVGSGDWSDMIGVLREELRESHSGGTEEGMIRASLRGLKGSAKEQANVKSLLLLFAVVPEDTCCPLEVLVLMFNAVHESSDATMMHLRKWLRILINHSLVLGTIDRPSLHDLVLDFAIAQHSDADLRQGHRRVVEAFRRHRPVDAYGRKKYERGMLHDDTVSQYVCAEVSYHVSKAWQQDVEEDEVKEWLGDVPQDAIVIAAGMVQGNGQLAVLAKRAGSDGDMWLAGRLWAVLCNTKMLTEGSTGTTDTTDQIMASLEAIDKFVHSVSGRASPQATDDANEVMLQQLLRLTLMSFENDPKFSAMMDYVLGTAAAARDPMTASAVSLFRNLPDLMMGNVGAYGGRAVKMAIQTRVAAQSDPNPSTRIICAIMCYHFAAQAFTTEGLDWDSLYGPGGSAVLEAGRAYQYNDVHHMYAAIFGFDLFMMAGASSYFLAVHYGNISGTVELFDKSLDVVRQAMDEPKPATAPAPPAEEFSLLLAFPMLQFIAHVAELPADRTSALAALQVECGLSWKQTEASVGAMQMFMVDSPLVRFFNRK